MRLAILGASARAAAFSALDAGHDVVAADLFADADLAARCAVTKIEPRPEAFVEWLSGQDVEGWLYTGSFENYPESIAKMARLRPLLGTEAGSLARLLKIEELGSWLQDEGCHFPDVRTAPPAPADARRWLAKPYLGAGGIGIVEWTPTATLEKPSYWQAYVEGTPISVACVANRSGCQILGVTRQLIGTRFNHASRFHYAGSIGPYAVTASTVKQMDRVAKRTAGEYGICGVFGMDFVVDTAGTAWAVDINSRYTASMEVVERVLGESILATHIAACTGDTLPIGANQNNDQYHGKAYLFAKRKVRFTPPGCDYIADIPREGAIVDCGKPICTVFAIAQQYDRVEPLLEERVQEIEQHLFPDQQQ